MVTPEGQKKKQLDKILAAAPWSGELDQDSYQQLPALRQSFIKGCLKSPLHAALRKQTPSLQLGSLLDRLVKEPSSFWMKHAREPEGDGRSKEVKDARKKFREECEKDDLIAVSADMYDKLKGMWGSIMNDPIAMRILEQSQPDLTLVWDSGDTELPEEYRMNKAALDFAYKEGEHRMSVCDLKSCQDASPSGFMRSVFDWGYDIQAAHYMEGVEACGWQAGLWTWIAVESNEPYPCKVHYATDLTLEVGKKRIQKAMENLKSFMSDKRKRAYGPKINPIDPPGWILHQVKEYEPINSI